jgi:hypothetical protein
MRDQCLHFLVVAGERGSLPPTAGQSGCGVPVRDQRQDAQNEESGSHGVLLTTPDQCPGAPSIYVATTASGRTRRSRRTALARDLHSHTRSSTRRNADIHRPRAKKKSPQKRAFQGMPGPTIYLILVSL